MTEREPWRTHLPDMDDDDEWRFDWDEDRHQRGVSDTYGWIVAALVVIAFTAIGALIAYGGF